MLLVDPIDRAIYGGQYEKGLQLCAESHAQTDWTTRYREALCFEGMQRYAKSQAKYLQAADLAGKAHRFDGWAASLLGAVRCDTARNEWESAADTLAALRLQSGRSPGPAVNLYEECLRAEARIALQRAGTAPTTDPLNPYAYAEPEWKDDPGSVLDRFPLADRKPAPPPAPEPLTVESDDAGEETVRVRNPAVRVLDLIDGLARATGVRILVDPETRALLKGHTVSVDVDGMPVIELLEALTRPGRTVVLSPPGTSAITVAPAAERLGPPAGEVRRALTRLLEVAPKDHIARVRLANEDAEAQLYAPAAAAYRFVLSDTYDPAAANAAAYNLGLVNLHLGQPNPAREAFLTVVDTALSPRWVELGRWWGARARMETGATNQAAVAFRKLLTAADKSVRSAAALGWVACLLLDDETAEAKRILDRIRFNPGDRHDALAHAFDAWCQFRLSPSANRKAYVLSAWQSATDGVHLGPAGVFLAGQAYFDVGRPERAAGLYDALAGRLRGPLGVRMTYEVARFYDRAGDRLEARNRYRAVAAADAGEWGAAARLRLAEYALRDSRPEDCLAACYRLLADGAVDPGRVGPVMGRAYESLGRYELAAACFAGRPPRSAPNE